MIVSGDTILEAVSPELKYIGVSLRNDYGLRIERGKTYAVIGANGCGKTTLGKILQSGWNIATNEIRGDKRSLKIGSVEFTDIHSLAGLQSAYYQQRFESTMNDDVPTVAEVMGERMDSERFERLCAALSLRDILDKRVNYLSSGELRKFLIVNVLAEARDLLIIDNPYIGLDEASRTLFNNLLGEIAARGCAVVLLLCNPDDIPDFTDVVVPMRQREVLRSVEITSAAMLRDEREKCRELFPDRFALNEVLSTVPDISVDYDVAFALAGCDVRYGNRVILHNVDWTVKAGEKWALLGENGAGKSTLLSLVCADNPQGYRNNITIFDRRRGTGESIWEIKSRIGYISPELHLYFNNGETLVDVVASGLRDTQGFFRRPDSDEATKALRWLKALGLSEVAQCRFNALSSGEQRLALLARTLIKGAPLLILDEPLHGLDCAAKKVVADVIACYAGRPAASMVYVTHYRNEIPECVEHIFTLKKER